ncbi:MAG: hypothetical protein RMH84_03385 [Sulfolobales archaeon]|nr:hypothetical protein [Sulfolobales archaeon]MCX8208195.1 hypothetical protein [Sulfolobales archaeon]MDW8010620.1 hypothetical protein [Sulfolobales archaeon]
MVGVVLVGDVTVGTAVVPVGTVGVGIGEVVSEVDTGATVRVSVVAGIGEITIGAGVVAT